MSTPRPWAEVSPVRSKKPRNTGERLDEVGECMELVLLGPGSKSAKPTEGMLRCGIGGLTWLSPAADELATVSRSTCSSKVGGWCDDAVRGISWRIWVNKINYCLLREGTWLTGDGGAESSTCLSIFFGNVGRQWSTIKAGILTEICPVCWGDGSPIPDAAEARSEWRVTSTL